MKNPPSLHNGLLCLKLLKLRIIRLCKGSKSQTWTPNRTQDLSPRLSKFLKKYEERNKDKLAITIKWANGKVSRIYTTGMIVGYPVGHNCRVIFNRMPIILYNESMKARYGTSVPDISINESLNIDKSSGAEATEA